MSKFYECDVCGHVFSEDSAKVVWDSDGRNTVYYNACPSCGCGVLAELTNCRICGALIRDTEDYCDNCKWDVRKIWERAVEQVMTLRPEGDYTDAEDAFIEFLQDNMGVI